MSPDLSTDGSLCTGVHGQVRALTDPFMHTLTSGAVHAHVEPSMHTCAHRSVLACPCECIRSCIHGSVTASRCTQTHSHTSKPTSCLAPAIGKAAGGSRNQPNALGSLIILLSRDASVPALLTPAGTRCPEQHPGHPGALQPAPCQVQRGAPCPKLSANLCMAEVSHKGFFPAGNPAGKLLAWIKSKAQSHMCCTGVCVCV